MALDAPDLAVQSITEGRWPVEVKLHGDFRSRRLKNTSDELRQQDARLRGVLVDSCRRFGLVVAGYSGRDDSVMDTLEEVLKEPGAFPAGLFWLNRGEDPPLPRVGQLLERAVGAGVEAALVAVENFDEPTRPTQADRRDRHHGARCFRLGTKTLDARRGRKGVGDGRWFVLTLFP